MKRLIVNADDFGLSPGVNAGIARAHDQGIVTSASLMVRPAAAREAAEYACSRPGLSVGLHVDLCEWAFRGGEWMPVYQVVPLDDARAVAAEVARQLSAFHAHMGRGPTHIDSHQHVHREEPLRSILKREAERLRVPLRMYAPRVLYCGSFYGQSDKGHPCPEGVSVESLLAIIRDLPDGVTELGCHPGLADDSGSSYGRERSLECEALCDPRAQAALDEAGVELISFDAPGIS